MGVSSDKLSHCLVERLSPLVPDDVTVHADGDRIDVYLKGQWQGSSGAASILNDAEHTDRNEALATAVQSVLNAVQDYIVTGNGTQWPSINGRAVNSVPHVKMDGQNLILEYVTLDGTEAIRVRDIGLDQVLSPPDDA